MMTGEVVMLKERFDALLSKYDEKKIKVTSIRPDERGNEFVYFEITVASGFDVIEIFAAGASHGINMAAPKS